MIKTYEIVADFSLNTLSAPKMVFVKDDNLSTQLNFTFDSDYPTIKLTYSDPNGTVYEQILSVANKKATFLVPNTFLTTTGYASISLSKIDGETIYTISQFIKDIFVKGNLGNGIEPTPEEVSLVNQVIADLNIALISTSTVTNYATEQGDYAKSVGEQLLIDKANGVFKGDIGLTGPKGDKGDKGDTGLQGPKGDTGLQGIQGLKGDKGDTGLKGDKGDKGEQGIQGLQGIQGEKGVKGDTGTSAYESATLGGYIGTESEFNNDLASIKDLAITLDSLLGA